MTELIWIIEALRTLLTGGSFDALMQKPGFVGTMVWVAAVLPSTFIALGIGLHSWSETPLGMWLGARDEASGKPLSTAQIDDMIRRHARGRSLRTRFTPPPSQG